MKLHEVLSPEIPSEKTKPEQVERGDSRSLVTSLINRLNKTTGMEFKALGSGMYATGVASTIDPGTVHRISAGDHPYQSIQDILQDPYFQYVAHIAKDDGMWSNPHFPKIYNVAIHKDDRGAYAFTTQIERLHPSEDADLEEIHALGRRYIRNWDEKVAKREGEQSSKDLVWWVLGQAMENYVDGHSDDIKDPQLKKALDAVREVHNSGDHYPDLHHGNLMLRRSPHGSTIVITDPLT